MDQPIWAKRRPDRIQIGELFKVNIPKCCISEVQSNAMTSKMFEEKYHYAIICIWQQAIQECPTNVKTKHVN